MAFLMESDAVVRFVITLILFQLLGIEIPACVCCHPVYILSKRLTEFKISLVGLEMVCTSPKESKESTKVETPVSLFI